TLEEGVSLKDKSGPFQEAKIRALKNISKVCVEQQINLYIVLEPSYHNVLYEVSSHEGFLKLIAELPSVNLLDFSDIKAVPQLAAAEYWKDRSHFNSKGAEVFSMMLNEAIKNNPPHFK